MYYKSINDQTTELTLASSEDIMPCSSNSWRMRRSNAAAWGPFNAAFVPVDFAFSSITINWSREIIFYYSCNRKTLNYIPCPSDSIVSCKEVTIFSSKRAEMRRWVMGPHIPVADVEFASPLNFHMYN